jgi:CheY-like chemotaxis protein
MSVDLVRLTYPEIPDEPLLAAMRAGVRRGTDLVRQILMFSRGLEGPRRPLPFRPLVEELTSLFRQTFPKSITITTALPQDLWLVNADPTQLLANLCINARDAMPEGGQLRIAARNQPADGAAVGLLRELPAGLYVVLTIEDTGTGIPAKLLDKIFEPFFTTKEVGKGTGLGLATAQSIVRKHSGRMEVESAVGKGTRFTIYLPAADAPAPAPAVPEPPEPPGGKGELLLVVEDDASLLNMAKVALTTVGGYRVLTASNGAEAVVQYAQQPQAIQAVLTDMTMPIMDGAKTIQALRRLNPAVKVIAFSGLYTGAATEQAGLPAVQAVLPKPYTILALLATVRSVLDAGSVPAAEPSPGGNGR